MPTCFDLEALTKQGFGSPILLAVERLGVQNLKHIASHTLKSTSPQHMSSICNTQLLPMKSRCSRIHRRAERPPCRSIIDTLFIPLLPFATLSASISSTAHAFSSAFKLSPQRAPQSSKKVHFFSPENPLAFSQLAARLVPRPNTGILLARLCTLLPNRCM